MGTLDTSYEYVTSIVHSSDYPTYASTCPECKTDYLPLEEAILHEKVSLNSYVFSYTITLKSPSSATIQNTEHVRMEV